MRTPQIDMYCIESNMIDRATVNDIALRERRPIDPIQSKEGTMT